MTATGLIVTGLSHLDVGLDIRGDFRGLVRFAVSSKPSRPARRQSVPPQVMRPYNHSSRLCAASSRALTQQHAGIAAGAFPLSERGDLVGGQRVGHVAPTGGQPRLRSSRWQPTSWARSRCWASWRSRRLDHVKIPHL